MRIYCTNNTLSGFEAQLKAIVDKILSQVLNSTVAISDDLVAYKIPYE